MTPSDIRALASRVETEESSEELRAAVLTAFGSEAEPESAPDPLRSVDDAARMMPHGWRANLVQLFSGRWYFVCLVRVGLPDYLILRPTGVTEPRARTAANLRALAWEKENAG